MPTHIKRRKADRSGKRTPTNLASIEKLDDSWTFPSNLVGGKKPSRI